MPKNKKEKAKEVFQEEVIPIEVIEESEKVRG